MDLVITLCYFPCFNLIWKAGNLQELTDSHIHETASAKHQSCLVLSLSQMPADVGSLFSPTPPVTCPPAPAFLEASFVFYLFKTKQPPSEFQRHFITYTEDESDLIHINEAYLENPHELWVPSTSDRAARLWSMYVALHSRPPGRAQTQGLYAGKFCQWQKESVSCGCLSGKTAAGMVV